MSPVQAPKSEHVFCHPINTSFKRLKNGLRLLKVILKHRYNGKITTIVPSMIKRYVKDATRGDVTDIGYALRYLERLGYVVRTNKGRPSRYLLLPSLLMILDEHGCLNGCENNSGLCGLYATRYCPFLEGIIGGNDD